jgi:sugar phosphate isomerase/epimerase
MKFAFSTVACPTWDFDTIASRAKEYGYDGVELRGFLNENILSSSNVFLTDARKIASMFDYYGVGMACVSSSIAMTGRRRADRILADDCRRFIETAQELGCGNVKLFDTQVRPGQSRSAAVAALAEWLMPLGDFAAEHGICLLIENALSFRSAKEMWLILERVNHPSICCCWDVGNAALIGEPPSVSIPTLNNRIAYVQVKDAKIGPLGATFCKLGDGDMQVEKLVIRLRGIGYDGWVSMEWDKAWLPGLADPEEILPDAIQKLREWTKPQIGDNGDATPSRQKPPAAVKAT